MGPSCLQSGYDVEYGKLPGDGTPGGIKPHFGFDYRGCQTRCPQQGMEGLQADSDAEILSLMLVTKRRQQR